MNTSVNKSNLGGSFLGIFKKGQTVNKKDETSQPASLPSRGSASKTFHEPKNINGSMRKLFMRPISDQAELADEFSVKDSNMLSKMIVLDSHVEPSNAKVVI